MSKLLRGVFDFLATTCAGALMLSIVLLPLLMLATMVWLIYRLFAAVL